MGEPFWLKDHFLWLAQYNTEFTNKPKDTSNVIIWQYTDRLRLAGIGVNLDGNYWLKSAAELASLAHHPLNPTEEVLPQEQPEEQQVEVTEPAAEVPVEQPAPVPEEQPQETPVESPVEIPVETAPQPEPAPQPDVEVSPGQPEPVVRTRADPRAAGANRFLYTGLVHQPADRVLPVSFPPFRQLIKIPSF